MPLSSLVAIWHDQNRRLFRRRSRTSRMAEPLEQRQMLTVAAEEQLFVYLLNRARHDPVAYQLENNLSADLSYVTPRGPLAVNDKLFTSAEVHSNDMATNNYFGHFSPYLNKWPNQMAIDAGYPLPFAGDNNYIESLIAGTTTAQASLSGLIYDGGGTSTGHRDHLLGIGDFWAEGREIGHPGDSC